MNSGASTARFNGPRVLVVDDDRRVQQSLADCLRLTGEVDVIGCAGSVRAALELMEQAQPDVVLLDPRLPDVEAGTALVRSIQQSRPAVRVVLTGWSTTPEQPELLSSACRYVSKNGSTEEFIAAVVHACGASISGPSAASATAS